MNAMGDAKTKSRPASPVRINISDAADLRRWALYFGLSEMRLKTVVHAVGPMVPDVRKEIERAP